MTILLRMAAFVYSAVLLFYVWLEFFFKKSITLFGFNVIEYREGMVIVVLSIPLMFLVVSFIMGIFYSTIAFIEERKFLKKIKNIISITEFAIFNNAFHQLEEEDTKRFYEKIRCGIYIDLKSIKGYYYSIKEEEMSEEMKRKILPLREDLVELQKLKRTKKFEIKDMELLKRFSHHYL